MITRNTDGTFTVAGAVTCLSEQAAQALLEDTGVFPLVDPLTIKAAQPPRTYAWRKVVDEVSGMPRVEVYLAA